MDAEKGKCKRCGGSLPPRRDTRGRRAIYCSGACRAAAHREKSLIQEVPEALPIFSTEELIDLMERELAGLTEMVENGAVVPANMQKIVFEARRLTSTIDAVTSNPPAFLAPKIPFMRRRDKKKKRKK